ncbi:MAG: SMI1/KNR4 family protein [Agriterribacter sp.]
MNEQLNRIEKKLYQLRDLDKDLILFGAHKHRYKLNRPLSIEAINRFEEKYRIKLPSEYVDFVSQIGNGGAGPYYGLERLENGIFDDLDYKRPEFLLNPSEPFLHTEPWNIKFESEVSREENEEEYENQYYQFEQAYFDSSQMNGVIAICNYGCGVSLNLVVNGKEYGNIWADDRGSDAGIFPSIDFGNKDRIQFLNWYELWLDKSIEEIESKTKAKVGAVINKEDQLKEKPWWKIW